MTKSDVKNKGKQFSKDTKYRIRQYVLLVQFVLLSASGGLAVYTGVIKNLPDPLNYLAVFAGAYAVIEALVKLDKVITHK